MTTHIVIPKQAFEPDLLIRPAYCRNEGPHGYLVRLAEANSMMVSELKKLGGGFDMSWLTRNRLVLDESEQSELYAHTAWIECLLREKKEIWNHQHARYCPLCLANEPIWRAGWELFFHDACAHHGVWLIDQCATCNQSVRWAREQMLYCQCGSDLRHAKPTAAPESVVRLASIIESRVLKLPGVQIPSPLIELDIEHIQRLVRYLGCHMNLMAGLKPLKLLNASSMQASWPVTSLAAEILAQWPSAFYVCWSRLQETSSTQKAGLSGVFKQAYYYLYNNLCDEKYDPVRVAFETWVLEEWQGGVSKRNRRLEKEVLRNAKWISVREAALEISASVSRVRNLVRDGYIEGKEFVSDSGRHFLMVRRDQLHHIGRVLEDEITMDAAMTILGIGKLRMREILQRLFPSASRVSGQASWRVSKQEVDAIMGAAGKLPRVSEPKTYQVSLGHVLRGWRWETETIALLIEAVKAGELMPVAKLTRGEGITDWVFDSTELRAWHADLACNKRDWLTIAEVAKQLNIHEEAAYWLARNRYLKCENVGPAKKRFYQVTPEAVEDLNKRVVFATELANKLGCSPRKVVETLAERRISPLQPRDTLAQCRQRVYLRTKKIEKFLIETGGLNSSDLVLV